MALTLPQAAVAGRAPRLFQQLENLAHPLIFALLAHLWLTAWTPRAGLPERTRLLTVLACLTLAGAALIRYLLHRARKGHDMEKISVVTRLAAE